MFQDNIKRVTTSICFALAIVFSMYYLATTHFSFMLSLFHYQMFNSSAIAYTLMRFVYVLLPILIFVPHLKMEKILRIKYTFYLLGILYLIGSTWVFYFFSDNTLAAFRDMDAVKEYLQLRALNFDYLVWDSFDLWGPVFSLIQAASYFVLGYFTDKDRHTVAKLYWVALAVSILLPFIYVYIISGIGSFSSLWLRKNIVLFTAGIFTGAGIQVASTSRMVWGETLWY